MNYDAFLTWAAKTITADNFLELRGVVEAGAFIFKKNTGAVGNDIRERRERLSAGNRYQ